MWWLWWWWWWWGGYWVIGNIRYRMEGMEKVLVVGMTILYMRNRGDVFKAESGCDRRHNV